MGNEKVTMTAQEAKTFDTYSARNAAEVEEAFPCGCKPYENVFTYNKWQALGMQVQKGEHGKSLSVIREEKDKDDDGNVVVKKKMRYARVFCRCQTKKIEKKGE